MKTGVSQPFWRIPNFTFPTPKHHQNKITEAETKVEKKTLNLIQKRERGVRKENLISFSSVLELASVKTRAPSEKIVDFARLDVIWEASNEEGLDVKEVMIGVARGSTGRQMHMQMHLHLVMGVGVGWDGKISQNRNSNLLQYWNYVDVSLSNTKLDVQQLGDNRCVQHFKILKAS